MERLLCGAVAGRSREKCNAETDQVAGGGGGGGGSDCDLQSAASWSAVERHPTYSVAQPGTLLGLNSTGAVSS